ncbi:Tkl protein kinase [Globisporangium polare]
MKTTNQESVVQIARFNANTTNVKFKELDLPAKDGAPSNKEASRQPWIIDTHDLTYKKCDAIGVGALGEVYRATWIGTPVVIKFMGFEEDEDDYSHEMFFSELRVWFPLNHPHIVKLYGACHVGRLFFVCEFMGNGTLENYLKRDGNSEKSWQLLFQVGLGLQHLHENNVLHNDLKCDNVLIGSDGDAKIADFGLSSILNSAEVQIDPRKQGAIQWRSPENMRGERLTLASDIYSFAMLILEAVTRGMPWGRTIGAVVRWKVLKKRELPPRPDIFSDVQWNLILMMCASNPAQRVKISFVVDKLHEFWQAQEQSDKKEAATTVKITDTGDSTPNAVVSSGDEPVQIVRFNAYTANDKAILLDFPSKNAARDPPLRLRQRDTMARVITAYHVSGVPNLTEIQPHASDSLYYDQYLYGAKIAAFTTTQYKGGLPTVTPYPRDAADGAVCYRYTKRFNPDHYFKFKMAAEDNQVHFLLLKKSISREWVVSEVLRRCLPDSEDADWDEYFPGGSPNEYSSSRVFVNVSFYHSVPVRYVGTVSKRAIGNVTRDSVPENYQWLGQLVETMVTRAAPVKC